MSENEKLIEEAEKAILQAWELRANSPDGTGLAESAAHSAFTIFKGYMEREIFALQSIAGVLYRDKALGEATVTPTGVLAEKPEWGVWDRRDRVFRHVEPPTEENARREAALGGTEFEATRALPWVPVEN